MVDGMNESTPDDIAYTYSHSGRAQHLTLPLLPAL